MVINVVGGVTLKGGQTHLDRPVFNTVEDAVKIQEQPNYICTTGFAADAKVGKADGGIKYWFASIEGIPTKDMVMVKFHIRNRTTMIK
jgi:succinyl-CoA synthetase alpha subunit